MNLNPTTYRRAIELILKSPDYSDQYKSMIRKMSSSNDFTVGNSDGTKSSINVDDSGVSVITSTHGTSGHIEKPKYIDSELVKSIDVKIDELIKPKKKSRPEVVPKKIHEDLKVVYSDSLTTITDLESDLNIKISEIATLSGEIESLNQEVDNEKIIRSAADNISDSANERYGSLLVDFQSTMQKGIEEAIQRVSLEAQVQGLTAQVEVLMQQIDSLDSQLIGAAAESSAAAAGFKSDGTNEVFWKTKHVQKKDGAWGSADVGWTTSKKHKSNNKASILTIKNLLDDDLSITQLTMKNSGDLSSKGPFGFTSSGKPSTTKTVEIKQGSSADVTIYANYGIGGKNDPKPKKCCQGARDYSGKLEITVKFSDGTTKSLSEIKWAIRKNKG